MDRVRDGNDFAGTLLRAGLRDAPGPRAAVKVAAALAIGGVSKAAIAAPVVGGAGTSSSAVGAGTGSLSTVSLLKSFGIGILLGTAGVGVASVASELLSSEDPPAPAAITRPRHPREAPAAAITHTDHAAPRPPARAPGPTPTNVASPARSRAPSPARNAVAPRRSPPPPAPEATSEAAPPPPPPMAALSVAEEVALLDRARATLAHRGPVEALRLLDADQPHMKTLWLEAQVLRVDALVRSGQHAAARNLAEGFIRTYPGTAHAARVRELLAAPQPPTEIE